MEDSPGTHQHSLHPEHPEAEKDVFSGGGYCLFSFFQAAVRTEAYPHVPVQDNRGPGSSVLFIFSLWVRLIFSKTPGKCRQIQCTQYKFNTKTLFFQGLNL